MEESHRGPVHEFAKLGPLIGARGFESHLFRKKLYYFCKSGILVEWQSNTKDTQIPNVLFVKKIFIEDLLKLIEITEIFIAVLLVMECLVEKKNHVLFVEN